MYGPPGCALLAGAVAAEGGLFFVIVKCQWSCGMWREGRLGGGGGGVYWGGGAGGGARLKTVEVFRT